MQITLTSPNGGESWTAGTSHNITWTSTGVTNVNLESSTNNGSSWTTIVSSTAASAGTYAWTVPNTPSTQCLVRISDASPSAVNDQSNAVFIIAGIVVTTPNGSESLTAGTSQNITWISSGVTNVKLEYTTDNGTNWTPIISSTDAATGSYPWTVPNTPSTQCLVRVSDAANAAVNDQSNAVFTIAGIVVTTPNGSESWTAGTSKNITWTSSGVTNVKLEYTTDNDTNWTPIISSTDAATGSYPWTVPNTPSAQCLVMISDASTAAVNDQSDAVFSIMPVSSLITEPINKVKALMASGDLNKGNGNALTVKLEGALDECNKGNYSVAVNQLGAFINQAEAFRGKKLTVAKADELISDAQKIIQIIHLIQGVAKPVLLSETVIEIPQDFSLSQNFPNPFNPITTIQYTIPAGKGGFVRITIYDSRGSLVQTLVDGAQNPGIHTATWNATDDSGRRISSGIYIYRLEVGSFTQTRKMLFLR